MESFVADHERCPNGERELVEQHYLSRLARHDPWGTPLNYTCTVAPHDRAEISVRSAGGDRRFWSSDDIVVNGTN